MPRTYREKWLGALAGVVIIALFLYVETVGVEHDLVYAIGAYVLFMLTTLASTRLVLYPERIESINLIARRSLRKLDIDHMEVRGFRFRGRPEKTLWLMPKSDKEQPLMVAGDMVMDESWSDWMASIPEQKFHRPEIGTAREAKSLLTLAGWIWLFASVYLGVVRPDANTYLIEGDSGIRVYACIGTGLFSLLLVRFSSIDTLTLKREFLAIVVGVAGFFGFGAATTVNELFDHSAPTFVQVHIDSRYKQTGRHAGLYFRLAPWGAEKRARSYRTSETAFMLAKTICAEQHSGAIGMRWYQLSDTCPEIKATK